MQIEVGDKVKVRNANNTENPETYTVLEIDGDFVKLKHPKIGGYFGFKLESISEVINENR
ncbi:MAG: hypothetical protein GOVbin703_176 [Prokaryotic dsDNA virus sp.]|nr:MAG: hypothetical protein GOVbin703_176 [Prokaryotic dsDNA virus sp.]